MRQLEQFPNGGLESGIATNPDDAQLARTSRHNPDSSTTINRRIARNFLLPNYSGTLDNNELKVLAAMLLVIKIKDLDPANEKKLAAIRAVVEKLPAVNIDQFSFLDKTQAITVFNEVGQEIQEHLEHHMALNIFNYLIVASFAAFGCGAGVFFMSAKRIPNIETDNDAMVNSLLPLVFATFTTISNFIFASGNFLPSLQNIFKGNQSSNPKTATFMAMIVSMAAAVIEGSFALYAGSEINKLLVRHDSETPEIGQLLGMVGFISTLVMLTTAYSAAFPETYDNGKKIMAKILPGNQMAPQQDVDVEALTSQVRPTNLATHFGQLIMNNKTTVTATTLCVLAGALKLAGVIGGAQQILNEAGVSGPIATVVGIGCLAGEVPLTAVAMIRLGSYIADNILGLSKDSNSGQSSGNQAPYTQLEGDNVCDSERRWLVAKLVCNFVNGLSNGFLAIPGDTKSDVMKIIYFASAATVSIGVCSKGAIEAHENFLNAFECLIGNRESLKKFGIKISEEGDLFLGDLIGVSQLPGSTISTSSSDSEGRREAFARSNSEGNVFGPKTITRTRSKSVPAVRTDSFKTP